MKKHFEGNAARRFRFFGKTYFCTACRQRDYFFRWHYYGIKSKFFKDNKIIGGGYRSRVVCPNCGANDRVRWVDYVIEHYTDIYKEEKSILHIAPEKIVRDKIQKMNPENYITGDIEEGVAEYVVDITDMNFPKESFDYIILNHVMEHVPDEKKAFGEITRCLKDEGILIISFPVCLQKKTYENIEAQSEEQRLLYYGQKDHCRLYGYDVTERMSGYGFAVKEYNVSQILTKEKIEESRFMAEDRIYLCRKRMYDNG